MATVLVAMTLSLPAYAQDAPVQPAANPAPDAANAAGAGAPPAGDNAAAPASDGTADANAPVDPNAPKPAVNKPHLSENAPVKSLFFTQEEMKALKGAVESFSKRLAGVEKNGSKEADFLKELEGMKATEQQEEKTYTYPQFYLSSLAYDNPKSWSIRVNQKQINQLTPKGTDDLTVLDIDRDKVTIEWKPRHMERVTDIWDVAPNTQVKVDDIRGVVTFALRLNQTFSSYTMMVKEGKLQPVTVVNDNNEVKIMPAAKKRDIRKTPDNPAKPDDGRGLGGLIDTYKKLNQE